MQALQSCRQAEYRRGRDPASQLTQTADKMREQHWQRQRSKSRKGWESGGDIGADALLGLPMMRTCQHERLAAEATADKDTRLQQISALQHKLKGYHLRVPLKGTSDCSRWVPISVKDWQLKLPLKKMPEFTAKKGQLTAEKEMPGLNVTEQDMGNNRLFSYRCLFFRSVSSKMQKPHPMQAWLHWLYHASLVYRLFLVP